ncbi:hypothetical protein B0H11DRAFT_2185726 [Mycena galericulata]|nr:hypothetical protein B0H11DRAFT_2185726 [Mycena galericulata]
MPPGLAKKTVHSVLVDEINASQLEDVPGLLPILFPDAFLPLPPSDILTALSAGDAPLYDGSRWVGCPDLTKPSRNGDVEAALIDFFHTFGERVADACRVSKPDLLPVCTVAGVEFLLPNIPIYGQSSDTPDAHKETLTQLLNGASLVFSSQDNRRFVVSLSFIAGNIRLFVFDRVGLVTTFPFDLHEDPESFVRVMAGLMFTKDPALLGYDTSIIMTPAGRFIDVDGVRYKIVETLFVSEAIRGKGTVCWRARYEGKDYVIKDTWVDNSRPHTEAKMLHMAKEVEGVPKVIADVVVSINGVEESTANLRSTITPPPGKKGAKLRDTLSTIEERIHRRLVLTPVGYALPHFSSRKELISIFIDAVTAHRELFIRANVLHRDISVNNIMLVPSPRTWNTIALPPTSPALAALAGPHHFNSSRAAQPAAVPPPSGPRRGLLIDLDYSLVIKPDGERGPTATRHRTASDASLCIRNIHDLESLLYVLIWICVHYAGPGNVERRNFDLLKSRLRNWVRGDSYMAIGMMKDSALRNPLFWNRSVLAEFAPYFEPLKPCASAWRQLYIDEDITYDTVLEVLRNALATLPEMEVWSKDNDPEGYGEQGKKRKRSYNHLERINEVGGGDDGGADEAESPIAKFARSETGRRVVRSAPPPSKPLVAPLLPAGCVKAEKVQKIHKDHFGAPKWQVRSAGTKKEIGDTALSELVSDLAPRRTHVRTLDLRINQGPFSRARNDLGASFYDETIGAKPVYVEPQSHNHTKHFVAAERKIMEAIVPDGEYASLQIAPGSQQLE